MSVVAEEKQFRLDWLKWLVVLLLVGGAIYANWYFSAESVLYRVLGLVAAMGLAGLVASLTAKGKTIIELSVGARTEWRVVWPTKQERNQTTLIVVAVILLMALILWGIDSLLSWVASLIMG